MALKKVHSGEPLQNKGTVAPTRAAGKPFADPKPVAKPKPATGPSNPAPRMGF